MRVDLSRFTLTEDHLSLIRAFSWEWAECERGGPAVNPKRPFGNSDIVPDIARLRGLEWPDEDEYPDKDSERDVIYESCMELYRQTLTAMEIVAQHAGKPVLLGVYVNAVKYGRPEWKHEIQLARAAMAAKTHGAELFGDLPEGQS